MRLGGESNLYHVTWTNEVRLVDRPVFERGPGSHKGPPYEISVFWRGLNPDIQVLCRSGDPLDGQCVCPDHEKTSLGIQQRDQKVRPILGHLIRITRMGVSARE